ncbi:membrane protein insertion efficiency factor YidD [Polynucleobacter sp. VK25]|uniref:membrane protein insertion efficiency factor YidD n=1 Tax=Polynucleobacter sp. VK25 TaxID=1758398 RepID=UPI0021135ED9|nr:membrane protein insertion efficiency factor YidD [Polynucleobacter sp. VK25]QWD68348.1 membrane protein insertion efficiency factor YidD [Polynucleobacter sp. VK25]
MSWLSSKNQLVARLVAGLEKKKKKLCAPRFRGCFKVRVLNTVAIRLVKIYQLTLSPYLGMHCKYVPSCSQYACDCFSHYGFIKSFRLTVWRILRCNPWSHGGYDPALKDTKH